MTEHWTNDSSKSFVFAVAMDFVGALEEAMEQQDVSQRELAGRLGISEGRVSQIINNPGNLTLRSAVEWARALGHKAALVAYDDGDADNERGPVFADVFQRCWEALGKPVDGASLATACAKARDLSGVVDDGEESESGRRCHVGNGRYWTVFDGAADARAPVQDAWKGTSLENDPGDFSRVGS